MRCILSQSNNIYYHLAAEEYLLKETHDEICMLWQSDPCVVVGKHQNTMAEVNYTWALRNKLLIARRLTGGGTVFHGPGNLNFTFIRNGEKGKLVDFKKFVLPIVNYLYELGIPAEIGTRNDILVQGKKISGNAEHVYKSRVLHHGTLLFNADLSSLKDSLRVSEGKYQDKAVQSVRSEVANIDYFLSSPLTFKNFRDGLFRYLCKKFSIVKDTPISPMETSKIDVLVNEKYKQWFWIFGYSPVFEMHKKASWKETTLTVEIKILKGLFDKVCFNISQNDTRFTKLSQSLHQTPYEFESVKNYIASSGFTSDEMDELLTNLF